MRAVARAGNARLALCAAALALAAGAAGAESLRPLQVDASRGIGRIRPLQGVDGVVLERDAGQLGIQHGPDLRAAWRAAHVDMVRSYIWQSRLDTSDNPAGLFPRWDANPDDPASYNFAATDALVRASRQTGADILFTIASAIPRSTAPARDLARYEAVVRHVVMHYSAGWADGFHGAVRYYEFGDEPDLNTYHFGGTPTEFYAMYAAAARAVKSVDISLQVGGPGLAFPLNADSPFREGFLAHVRAQRLPFDFFSWKWYADGTEDPWDFVRVAKVTTELLARHGLSEARQIVSNWNYYAIPILKPEQMRRATFEVAALIYMQDTDIDRAVMFRGDAAMGTVAEPDADKTTRMFDADGTPQKNGWGFRMSGAMQDTPQRLRVTGGDDRGYAVLAGRNATTGTVQVLIANYAIPAKLLEPTDRKSLDFVLPVQGRRVPVSMALPERRVGATQHDNDGYDLGVNGLGKGRYVVERYRLDPTHDMSLVDAAVMTGPALRLRTAVPEPAVELIVIRPE